MKDLLNTAMSFFDWITFIPTGIFFAFLYAWPMAPSPEGLGAHPWMICFIAVCVFMPLDVWLRGSRADWYALTSSSYMSSQGSIFNTIWYCVTLPWFGYWWFLNDGYMQIVNAF